MKKIILILIILLAFVPYMQAQDSKIENIDKTCKAIDEKIGEDEGFGNYWVHSIKLTTNRRAIGPQTTTIKFYYEQQGDTMIEKNGSTDFVDIYPPPAKVRVEYNIAASQNIRVDYYSDAKGNLIYYYYLTQGAYTEGEEKIYFEKNKPILVKSKGLDSEYEVLEKYKDYERNLDFTKEDLKKCKQLIKNWKDYKKMFEQMIYVEKIDK